MIEPLHAPHKLGKVNRREKPIGQREALDDLIERAVSRSAVALSFREVLDEVMNDYGSLGPTESSGERRLHRRLRAVCGQGRVTRVKIDKGLYAYVKPGSYSERHPEAIRELMLEKIDYSLRGLCRGV